MIRSAQWLYIGLAWVLMASVVIQVFLAGIGLFTGQGFGAHRAFGAVVHLLPLLILGAGAVARVGRARLGLALLLFAVISVQAALPSLRAAFPLAAALHPVGALAIFWLAMLVVRRAPRYAQATGTASSTERATAAAGRS